MSHFTKVKTQLSERRHLRQALEDLASEYRYEISEGNVHVRGYHGQTTPCQIKLDLRNQQGYDIGFRQETPEQAFDVVADWWSGGPLANFPQQQFLDQVSQRYAYHNLKANLGKFQVMKEVQAHETEDGSIRILLRQVG